MNVPEIIEDTSEKGAFKSREKTKLKEKTNGKDILHHSLDEFFGLFKKRASIITLDEERDMMIEERL